MQKITFVIGATAGKSYFIENNYCGKDIEILDVLSLLSMLFSEYFALQYADHVKVISLSDSVDDIARSVRGLRDKYL